MKALLLGSIALFIGYLSLTGPVQAPIPDDPVLGEAPVNNPSSVTQFNQLTASKFTINLDDYSITALADVAITARVLGKENYVLGREADLSPTDLALGWGPMSESKVLAQLSIRQSGRWYRWQTLQTGYPIPRIEIERNSANMHMIPANEQVARALKNVRQNEIISLTGYLVNVIAADGWHWKSSLSRNDTGEGACELIWVTQLKRLTHG